MLERNKVAQGSQNFMDKKKKKKSQIEQTSLNTLVARENQFIN